MEECAEDPGLNIPPELRPAFELAVDKGVKAVLAARAQRRQHGGFPRGDAESVFSTCVAPFTGPDEEVFARYTRFTYPEFVRLLEVLGIAENRESEEIHVGRPTVLSQASKFAMLLWWLARGEKV